MRKQLANGIWTLAEALTRLGHRVRAYREAPGMPRGGQWVEFAICGSTLGRPTYRVWSRRGHMPIGLLEFRNQWQRYAFQACSDVPYSREILAEIHARMRELEGR